MKIRLIVAASAFALAVLNTSAANATIVLSDDFGSDANVTLNWTGDWVFIPSTPPLPDSSSAVDLVGSADGYGNLAYQNGVSLDLDGSEARGGSTAGAIQSVLTLPNGDYTLSFLLAGNLRGASNKTTRISIGSQFMDITPASSSQRYTLYTEYFTNASGNVGFMDLGPADHEGNLLDNILVTSAVPEPATWAMLLIGFGAVGFAIRSRREKHTGANHQSK